MRYVPPGLGFLLMAMFSWAAPLQAALVETYDLGTITLVQPEVPSEAAAMPVPLTGSIAVPDGEGPFPLVVILHGRHPGCHFANPAPSQWPCTERETRYDQGFSYLADHLAEAGYLTLVPNLNGAYADAYGSTETNRNRLAHQRGIEIATVHIQRLLAAHGGEQSGFSVPLLGNLNIQQIAIVGHSLGGSIAALLTESLGPQAVDGLLLLAPTPSLPVKSAQEAYQLPNVPTSVLIGSCDRDVFDLSSLYYFERASQHQQRSQRVSATLVLGANHNFFNTAIMADDYRQLPNNSPQCSVTSPQRLSRQDQADFTATYTRAFVASSFKADLTWDNLGLALDQKAPSHLFGIPVATNLALPSKQLMLFRAADYADMHSPENTNLEFNRLTPRYCPALSQCGDFIRLMPQFPSVLRLSWQQPARLRWHTATPLNAQAYDSLQLRLAVDSSDLLNAHGSPSISITLGDNQGRYSRINIPASEPALRLFAPDQRWGYQTIPSYATALRIPLNQFSGIHLDAIATVDIDFDKTPQGTIEIAEIGLIGAP